ncbi:MAG TPA: hypothetical protein VHM70_01220 [Polyangiaceae bacterium]|nr:hypothetical protein [Polyangiaceae bacterium]
MRPTNQTHFRTMMLRLGLGFQEFSRTHTETLSVLTRGAYVVLGVALLTTTLTCLVYQGFAASYAFQLDYGEGPLVDQAARLASGRGIYSADLTTGPFTISNYPPIYPALLSICVRLFGVSNAFHAGRLLSSLAAWGAAISIGLIVQRTTKDRVAAWVAAGVFLAFPFLVWWSSLTRIDLIALWFSLSALAVAVHERQSALRSAWVAALLAAAVYSRQSYVLAAPLAAIAWTAGRNLKHALVLVATYAALIVTAFLALDGWTRGGFYFNVVTANVNEFSWGRVRDNWHVFRDTTFPILALAVCSVPLLRRKPSWRLQTLYLIGAAAGAVTIGKIGSQANYLLESCAALCVATGGVLAWARSQSPKLAESLVVAVTALGVGRLLQTTVTEYAAELRRRYDAAEQVGALYAKVAAIPGAILADEYMGALPAQGRPLLAQPFEISQLARSGGWNQRVLLRQIEHRDFSAILIYDRPWLNERWTVEMLNAIDQSYRVSDRIADNKLYTPRLDAEK